MPRRTIVIIEAIVLFLVVASCTLAACNAFAGLDPHLLLAIKGWLPVAAGIVLIVSGKFGGYFFLRGLDSAVDDDKKAMPRILWGIGFIALGLTLSGAIHSVSQTISLSSEQLWRVYIDRANKDSQSTWNGTPEKPIEANNAEQMYKEALRLAEAFGGTDKRLIISINNLALFYNRQKKFDLAEPLFKRMIALHTKYRSGDPGTVGLAQEQLAQLYKAQGKHELAGQQYKEALLLYEHELLRAHPAFVAQQTQNILRELHEMKVISDGELVATYEHLIRSVESFSPSDIVWFVDPLARWKLDHGELNQADKLFQQELPILELKANKSDRHNHYTIQLANALDAYSTIVEKRGQKKQALELGIRAFKLRNKPDMPVPQGFLDQLRSCEERRSL